MHDGDFLILSSLNTFHYFPAIHLLLRVRERTSEPASEMAASSRCRTISGGGHGRLLLLLLACSWVAAATGQQTARTDPAEGTYARTCSNCSSMSMCGYCTEIYKPHMLVVLREIISSTKISCVSVICNPTCICLISLGAKFSSVHKHSMLHVYIFISLCVQLYVQWRR